MTAPAFLQFPRGAAALQVHVSATGISAQLYGPRQGHMHPQLFCVSAPNADCWRTTSTFANDPMPEKLFIGGACIGLTREEADQVDMDLREHAPGVLSEREAA